MTTITDPTAIAAIRNAYDQHDWQAAYNAVLDAITTTTLTQDGSGLVIQSPASGVDPAVWTWIAGAVNVNGNSGAFASYIREYTAEQYLVRTGITLDTGTTGPIQIASDKICQRFILDLFGQLSDPNQAVLPSTIPDGTYDSLTLPDLDQIGAIDAGAAASEIFQLPANDYSPWAGTVLFTQIGDDSFFKNWVLTTNVVEGRKTEPGTYDLATVAKVTADQGTPGFALRLIGAGELSTALSVMALGSNAVSDAISSANSFFAQTYGVTGDVINIGYDIFSSGPFFGLSRTAQYIVGQIGNDDALAAVDAQEFLNAGRGDDTIIGAFDPNSQRFGTLSIIDGGDGTDTVDYSTLSVSTDMSFDNAGQLGPRIILDKGTDIAAGHEDLLYEVERVKLGLGKNTVSLSSDVNLRGVQVNGRAGTDTLSLASGMTATIGDGRSISAAGADFIFFEKLKFSGNNNTLSVGQAQNPLSDAPALTADLGATLYSSNETLDFSQYAKSVYLSSSAPQPGNSDHAAGLFRDKNLTQSAGLSFQNFTTLDLGAGDDTVKLTTADDPYLHVINTGGGDNTITTDNIDVTINLEGTNDKVLHAGKGSVINIGQNTHATIVTSDDVLIEGLKPTDVVMDAAGDILHGALGSPNTEAQWIYGYDGTGYGLNSLGQLGIKDVFGNITWLADYVGGPAVSYAGQMAGIFVGTVSSWVWSLAGSTVPLSSIPDQTFKAANDYLVTMGLQPIFNADPLVLDLGGNGFDLTNVGPTSPMLDMNIDGFRVHTGWVSSTDALLVYDKNGNGIIDNASEIFGGAGVNGFAALGAYTPTATA